MGNARILSARGADAVAFLEEEAKARAERLRALREDGAEPIGDLLSEIQASEDRRNDELAGQVARQGRSIQALEEMVTVLRASVCALTVVNSAMMGRLGDHLDRAEIREASLSVFGEGPEDAAAVAIVHALTGDASDDEDVLIGARTLIRTLN